ncbi:MAG: endolytic transglycosylase MltG [Bacillota bacterium]|nr:endolytic transglycosylase MltG [Bacillota bacterium]
MSRDFYSNSFSDDEPSDSIDETRRKKIDGFKLQIDKELLGGTSSDDVFYDDIKSYIKQAEAQDSNMEEINSYSGDETRKRMAEEAKNSRRAAEKIEKKQIKEKSKKNRFAFRMIWLSMVVLAGIVLSQVLLVGVNDLLAINRKDKTSVKISIPANPTLDQVTNILLQNKLINSKGYFEEYAKVTKAADGFHQGQFNIKRNLDYEAIINYLQMSTNRTDTISIQFSEGMSIREIASKLHEKGVTTDENKFLQLCSSNQFDKDYPFIAQLPSNNNRVYKLEGYLFPDTYTFYLNEDPATTICRFLANYRDKIWVPRMADSSNSGKLATIQEQAKRQGMSMNEVMILASIIQAEAASKNDMYNVSSVLHNRIDSDIDSGLHHLGCDSTVYYPYRDKASLPSNMKSYTSKYYDTYDVTDLNLAGAICSPGYDAIDAALHPNSTDYYYFCHKPATKNSAAKAYYAETEAGQIENEQEAGLIH